MMRRIGIVGLCWALLLSMALPLRAAAQEATPAPAPPVGTGQQLFEAEGVQAPMLAQSSVDASALGGAALILERIELAAGTSMAPHVSAGPELLYVEAGTLSIQDDFGFGTSVPAGGQLSLNTNTGYTATNEGTEATSVLRLRLGGGAGASATPEAATAGATVTELVNVPVPADAASMTTLFMAQATFAPESGTGEKLHAGPIGVYILDGTLKITSPSGLEGDLQAGRGVGLPAETPLKARTEIGATVMIVGLVDASQGLLTDPAAEPTPETAPTEVPATPEPTAVPTEVPTPEPTPEPRLFEAGGGTPFGPWAAGSGWLAVDDMIVSDGQSCSYLVAPVNLSGVRDYAIEAEIQIVALPTDSAFGLFGRWTGQVRYATGIYNDGWSGASYAPIGYLAQDDELNRRGFRGAFYSDAMSRTELTLDGAWHTYRFEMRGNEQRLYIDGAEVTRSTDNRIVSGGDAGLFCHGQAQISVRSFAIVGLGESAGMAAPSAATTDGQAASSAPGIAPMAFTGDLASLLPTASEVPSHLTLTDQRSRDLPTIAANYLDPADITARFTEWGWQANVVGAYGVAGNAMAPDGQINGIYVSVHAFGSPEGARAALDFSLQDQAASTGASEISVTPLGDYSRALYGPMNYGNEVTLLVQRGNLLLRLSAATVGGDPTSQAVATMQSMLTRAG